MIWGVDSVMRATDMVHGVSLYDHLVRWVSRLRGESIGPAFWGRYVTRPHNRPPLTREEAKYLLDRGCKILLIAAGVHTLRGRTGFENGRDAALEIGNIAWNLGAPPGVRIYADLEDGSWDRDWILGWWSAMHGSRYAGVGLYGGALRQHSWGPSLVSASRVIFAGEHPNLFMSEQGPDQRMSIDRPDQHMSVMAPYEASCYVWSSRPCLHMGTDPRTRAELEPGYSPQGPAGYNIETTIWQYREGCPLGTHGSARVDMDLATPSAFREMWPPGH